MRLARAVEVCVRLIRSQFLRELHFIEALKPSGTPDTPTSRSSFGNCTSLRRLAREVGSGRQPLRRSSFGNCTSLRLRTKEQRLEDHMSQFLRELHFIEASMGARGRRTARRSRSSFGTCTSLRLRRVEVAVGTAQSQFLRELHFIEATGAWPRPSRPRRVAVPSGTALH